MQLTDSELKTIQGGGSLSWLTAIGAAVTFIIGLFDGYMRPLRCN